MEMRKSAHMDLSPVISGGCGAGPAEAVCSKPEFIAGQKCAMVLCYHTVTDSESAYLYNATRTQFEEHVRLVVEGNKRRATAQMTVTFDDGHASAYLRAAPVLQRYSVPAIFFVTAGWIGVDDSAMTWEHLRELVRQGHNVQAHGWSHRLLTHCSDLELEDELTRSKETLENRLGVRVDALSFPGGRWNRRVLEACARAGYEHAYCSEPWIVPHLRGGVMLHGRLMVRRTMNPSQLLDLCTPGSRTMRRLRVRSTVQQAARFFLGDNLYLAVWRKLARKPAGKETE